MNQDTYQPDLQAPKILQSEPPRLPEYQVPFQYFPVDVDATAPNSKIAISFLARFAILNNLSGQWFYLPFANTYLPPYTIGVGVTFPAGSQIASFTAETPFGFISVATAGQRVTGTFYSIAVPNGTSLDVSSKLDVNFGQTLKTVAFSLNASGNVIAPVALKVLKIYAYKMVASANLITNWTLIEGGQSFASMGGAVEDVNPPKYLFKTGLGLGLDLTITGAGTVAGRVSYWDDDNS